MFVCTIDLTAYMPAPFLDQGLFVVFSASGEKKDKQERNKNQMCVKKKKKKKKTLLKLKQILSN